MNDVLRIFRSYVLPYICSSSLSYLCEVRCTHYLSLKRNRPAHFSFSKLDKKKRLHSLDTILRLTNIVSHIKDSPEVTNLSLFSEWDAENYFFVPETFKRKPELTS